MITDVDIRVYHGFGGLGGGAKGFNRGQARVANMRAKFRCIGGFDVDPAACRDFLKLAGVPLTCIDLFSRDQYTAFHGHEPPPGWREATPQDIQRSAWYERPHIVFLSAPCKGFSGLLSETRSQSGKYQALNQLAIRALWLMLEAWADDPPELFIFENVPRIANRGRKLLDQITELLHAYGYAVAETTHDCGEIGGLAQSRKRFLMVARHQAKVPAFLYQPPKRPLRAVGEILSRMPLPGDPAAGPMHGIPNLQWKTWVRLAFVEAGSDWRSLNKLRVADGKLQDYLIVPQTWHESVLGVQRWEDPSGTIIGNSTPTAGKFAVADPRVDGRNGDLGVVDWKRPGTTVIGNAKSNNGNFSVADPRFDSSDDFSQYGVRRWDESTGVVTSQRSPGQGPFSVADPRMSESAARHQNVYRIVRFDEHSRAIIGANHVAGGAGCVADPRPPDRPLFRKYHVTPWDKNTGTVIGGHHSEEGGYAVSDPRMPAVDYHVKKYKVNEWDKPTRTVISGSTTGDGAFAVADPRIRRDRETYMTAGEYGVVPWNEPSGAVQAQGNYDNGRWSVADPRLTAETKELVLPEEKTKLVCIIRSLDGTWHRPFTTLELAALQSLVDPEEMFGEEAFDLCGNSDSSKRERIGNAVPPGAAEVIAGVMGHALLASWSGERFQLSAQPVWVQPIAIALSVRPINFESEVQR
ncbi:MAG TPA: DNA cytosine methyltransferase [Candidatus Angelobacter sp.]|jgi:site-specific DNA-cytosine methylase|nr:DNA cytosine methyltransferase [Candidatus Angelobacter sp.]